MTTRYMMRVIEAARRRTDNDRFTRTSLTGVFTSGLSHDHFLDFLNEAQDHLQSKIISEYSSVFIEDKIIPLVANQELYLIEDNVHLNNKLVNIQYSHSSELKHYRDFPKKTIEERCTDTARNPSFYIRAKGGILVNPIPRVAGGSLRVSFYRELDDLDIRRGLTDSVADGSTTWNVTFEEDSDLDTNALSKADKVCFVDKYGEVQYYNATVDAVSLSASPYTMNVIKGDIPSAAAITGAYVVIGEYATTHSALPKTCERYLKTWAQLRILHKDSSIDAVAEDPVLQAMERDILEAYAGMDDDMIDIPMLDTELY